MIWCVDDDVTIRDIEVYTLQQMGFESRSFANGTDMLAALKNSKPDLILLDIMMPNEDGISILKQLKQNPSTQHIPVILASAKGTEMDKIVGLDIGADDYIVKPFGMMEMVSRIKAVLRRVKKESHHDVLASKGLEMRIKEHTVHVDGEKISLTHKEFELLKCFLTHQNIVFSREQLLFNIWGNSFIGESRTVDMHIKTLRQKIEPYAKCIETIFGVGYKWSMDNDKKNI